MNGLGFHTHGVAELDELCHVLRVQSLGWGLPEAMLSALSVWLRETGSCLDLVSRGTRGT